MLKRVWSIVVAVVLLLTMACFAFAENATALSVTVSDADLRPGDAVTATVQLNNYADNWSTMAVNLTYDTNLFALKDGTVEGSVRFSYFTEGIDNAVAEIYETAPGVLKIAWIATDNIVKGSTASVPLIKLDLVAKAAVSGSAAVSATFDPNGQTHTDETGLPVEVAADGEAFATESATAPVTVRGVAWEAQPVIRLELEKDRVQVGHTFKAYIYIDKYLPWSRLSAQLDFDSAQLEITEATALGFTGEVAVSGNTISVTNSANVDATGSEYLTDGSLRALEITFKPLAAADSAAITASFAAGGQTEAAEGVLEADVHYSSATSPKALTIVPDKTDLEVLVDAPEGLKAGQEFDVYVNLKEHENAWAAFTLVGTYDPEKFELVAIDTDSYDYGYEVIKPEKLTDALEVVWLSTGNIKTESNNPTVMKLTFKALQAADAATITFAFKEGGVVAENEEGVLENLQSGVNFTEEDKSVAVDVAATPMYLTYEIEGDVTEVKAGQTVSVVVSVNDYYEKLAALSIKGSYDKAQFDLVAVEPLLEEFGETGAAVIPDVGAVNAGEEELEIVWIGAENAALAPSFEAVRLTFRAKEQAEAAAIGFNFIESGVLRMGADGLPEKLEAGTYFETETVTATVKIAPAKVLLDVRTDAENVVAGDTFTVEVYVVDYYSPLAGFSVEGILDPATFEVLEYSAETVGGVAPTVDEEELEFVWFSTENIVTGQQEFKVLTLQVKALQSTDETTDTIRFGFINGGMVRVDSSGMVSGLTAGTDYADPATEPATVRVSVSQKPVELIVSSEVSTVEAGQTFDVTVSLSEYYEGDWSALGIWADFDASEFAIADAVSAGGFDGTFAWTTENENGKPFVAGWVALENQALTDPAVLTVTFRALADAAIDDALEHIDFYFAPDATYTCVDADALDYQPVAADGTAYVLDAEVFEINIIASDATVEVTLTWGAMEFTYNYGAWDVDNHTWNNAGWVCDEGADTITVENTGDVGVNIGFTFALSEGMTGLTGTFDNSNFALPVGGEQQTVLFTLAGKTEEEWETERTVGVITLTITADGAIDEEVTP